MDQDKVSKENVEILELSEVKPEDKNPNSIVNNEEERRETNYSNIDSLASTESFSKYVFDRSAPSFFMILAEQEISRQESLNDEEAQNLANMNTLQNVEMQLDSKLKALENVDHEKSEHRENTIQKEESKMSRRDTVRFQSLDEIFEPNHENLENQQDIDQNEAIENMHLMQSMNQNNNDLEHSTDTKIDKESSVISFQHKVYDETTTFKMLPEIENAQKKRVEIQVNDQKIFGTTKPKNAYPIEEYCQCEITIPRSRSYGVLANVVLKTISMYSISRQMHLDEIKKQISMAEMHNEISGEEVTLLEHAVERIEQCEELKTLDPKDDGSLNILMEYITKLFEMLKEILFGNQNANNDMKAILNVEEEKSESEMTPTITEEIELSATNVTKEEVESTTEKLKKILLGSQMQIKKEFENDLCMCNKIEETQMLQKSEIDIESSDGILRTVRKSITSAKSQELFVNETPKQSFEEIFKTVKSQSSVVEEKLSLQKFKNVEDLSAIGLNTSPGFVLRTSDIEGNETSNFVKYPKPPVTISVLSVPSVHLDASHATDVLKSSLMPNYLNKKGERMSNAVINDLNDDGFVDLPKVPSNALSGVSSSAWIDENASFVVDPQTPKKSGVERVSFAESPAKSFSEVKMINQEPSTSTAIASTSSTVECEKSKSKFRKCKCFLRKLSRTFHRNSKNEEDGKKN
ncbi:hypothetical protein PVAND_000799 [Polypedilum vanderplanki]|uniref:Uncharacterized protein n=1 Tax=Polypedilum vanderplanki TaxID=319348 RepID=A0A9J6BLF2_POLVA|nr:hypothetical protein PVAND_000799 [Polypedilum vanderplanki]